MNKSLVSWWPNTSYAGACSSPTTPYVQVLNLIRFGLVWFVVLWFVVCGFVVLWFIRKIRPTQLWVELSWVVAISFDLLIKNLPSTRLAKLEEKEVPAASQNRREFSVSG